MSACVSAFGQLVDGVSALHRFGKLHRDIKPSNVLVTPEARVVILDFGLITELVPSACDDGADIAGGTPAYMAPETGSSASPTEAADWYAVGVTLFEALTGQASFPGPGLRRASPKKGARLALAGGPAVSTSRAT